MSNKPLILTASPDPVDPDPGIYRNLPFEEYQRFNCFSKFIVAPALKIGLHLDHYIHNYTRTKPKAPRSLVDTLLLEPQ